MATFIIGLIIGAIAGAVGIFFFVRNNKEEAKKDIDKIK